MYINKNTLMHIIKIMGVVSSLHLVSAVAPWENDELLNNGNNGNNGNGNGGGNKEDRKVTVGEVQCVYQVVEPLMVENITDGSEVASEGCVMEAAYEDGIQGILYLLDPSNFPHGFLDGDDVVSSETLITISEAAVQKNKGKHGGGLINASPNATFKKEKKSKKVKDDKDQNRSLRRGYTSNRKLAQTMGDSTLIVLYAMPPDAVNDIRSSVQLANDIFGLNTTDVQDEVNAKSQMLACSRGQLNYVAACGDEDPTCSSPLITNGVLEVPITDNVSGVASGTVVNWVTAQAQVILNGTGIDIYSFEQIMVVIPDEASWGGAAAWAYLPGQLSAFRDDYAYRMGIQMHEFGHNLGLGHSGFNGQGYADYSCLMGSPSYGDDGPALCWNGAKSWELGWYQADSISVDPSLGSASVDLVGVADWTNNVYTSGEHKVVLEIDQPENNNICGSYSTKQADYRGTINTTESGRTCQAWSSQSPHTHSLNPAAYPDSGLDENFCRNPDGEDFAWCYTTDPLKRWEYCDVPLCPSSSQKPYVIYNRAKGPNEGVSFAKDEVTITMGSARSTSWHQASLGAPDPVNNVFPLWRQPNYKHGTKDLVVKVCSMTDGDSSTAPDTASILVYMDDGPGLNNGVMCPGEVSCISDSQCDDGNYCTENICDLESNTCMPPVDISATLCPTCGEQTFCNPDGGCYASCHDGNTCTSDTCVDPDLGVCQHDPIPGCAVPGATLETWFNLDGSKIEHLTRSMSFQDDSPDEVLTLRDDLKSQPSRGNKYGARLETYLTPSVSGIYNLYVASDDYSQLYLSTDDDPENKSLIAYVNGYTQPGNFIQKTSQKSSDIYLEAGTSYYLEAYHKEGGGGDHLSIAWESADAGVPLEVIDDLHFFVEAPVPCIADSDCMALVANPTCYIGYCDVDTSRCVYQPIDGAGATLDIWSGISGGSVGDLTTDERFPDYPDTCVVLDQGLEIADNIADNYGSRLRSYVTPPITCDYTFYIASDDSSQLKLSNDTNPINKVQIASVSGWTGKQVWDKYTSQKSDPIYLEQGQSYYLEVLHKEGGGADHLAVAWECLEGNIALEVVGSSYISALPPVSTKSPSGTPTSEPTSSPSLSPSRSPSKAPSQSPETSEPTKAPSKAPVTDMPSRSPSQTPSRAPSKGPSVSPSSQPTSAQPTSTPSRSPSANPSQVPTSSPSSSPSKQPSKGPSISPSKAPSQAPSISPSNTPTKSPVPFLCSTVLNKPDCQLYPGVCVWVGNPNSGSCNTAVTNVCEDPSVCSTCPDKDTCNGAGCNWGGSGKVKSCN